MKRVTTILLLALSAAPATAEQPAADPRALTECQQAGGTFVQINDCLPNAHVAFKTLDAFEAIYPSEAAPLMARCLELNERTTSASTCITTAIQSAIQLGNALPDGASLDDPVFNSISDEALLSELTAAIAEARQMFPERRVWGGGTYRPYS